MISLQLNEIQSRFKGIVLGEYDDVSTAQDFHRLFETNNIDVSARLHVYRNNVLEKLVKALEITYPTVHVLVGDDFFKQITRLYVRKNPPIEGCVNLYGEQFPSFIANLSEASSLPYIHDVALYDWFFNAAFYAKNDESLDVNIFQSIPPEQLSNITFTCLSSLHLIDSDYPLTSIREFCDVEVQKSDKMLNIDEGGEKLLLYRPHLKIKVLYLQDDEFLMLQYLKQGHTIGQSLEAVMPSYNDFDFQKFLQKMFDLQVFCNVIVKKQKITQT